MVAFVGKGGDEIVVDSWDGCKTILDATTFGSVSFYGVRSSIDYF
jgi:hypothetical protein